MISTGADEEDRPVGDEDFVFIDTGTDEHLVILARVFQRRAGADIRMRVPSVDNQRPAPLGIGGRLAERFLLRPD
jgi:hypothetical protein